MDGRGVEIQVSARKRKRVSPKLLTSLSQRQARWLIEARDTDGGVYVPITAGCEPSDLVDGGAAIFREFRGRSAADTYLVPTEHGLELLRADAAIAGPR